MALKSGILAGGATKGRAPNVEAIAALAPDLVAQWAYAGAENIGPMRNAGLNVATFGYGGDDESPRKIITTLGQAIGREDRATIRSSVSSKRHRTGASTRSRWAAIAGIR